jgi:hypothetical protein
VVKNGCRGPLLFLHLIGPGLAGFLNFIASVMDPVVFHILQGYDESSDRTGLRNLRCFKGCAEHLQGTLVRETVFFDCRWALFGNCAAVKQPREVDAN